MNGSSSDICCEGWWQQPLFGRQPMHDLRLRFDRGRVTGSGYDIIGLFTLRGTISAAGVVHLHKKYLGQHSVEYLGHYDGEGTLWGQWHIGQLKDRWLIKITGNSTGVDERAAITEIA